MRLYTSLVQVLIVAFLFVGLISAASPTSFCKCTCFSNSTIIALNAPTTDNAHRGLLLEKRASKKTCADCNRQFCMSYNLDICKDAKEENIFTTCFQRDSAKDEAVVFIFIVATVGLLTYAAVGPLIERWAQNARERRQYIPVSSQGEQQ